MVQILFSLLEKLKKGENTQDGHEAIRPVNLDMTPDKLSKYINDRNLLRIYDIIYKRTIAAAMKSSIVSETTYTIKKMINTCLSLCQRSFYLMAIEPSMVRLRIKMKKYPLRPLSLVRSLIRPWRQ